MKPGDQITIQLPGHGAGCKADCPCDRISTVAGKVVEALKDGFVQAEIDEQHPLRFYLRENPEHPGRMKPHKRILTVAPELYWSSPERSEGPL